jgi:hypothetical protein
VVRRKQGWIAPDARDEIVSGEVIGVGQTLAPCRRVGQRADARLHRRRQPNPEFEVQRPTDLAREERAYAAARDAFDDLAAPPSVREQVISV